MSTEKKEVATIQKDITAQVLTKIEGFKSSGELRIPEDYSPENALKSAYLILSETKNAANKNALEACSNVSIANALLKMVVWGLSPMKKQCSFIMYGDKLECQMEYTGNIALAKRWGGLVDIKGRAVFKGDEFAFETDTETGRISITKHIQTLESMASGEVIGAYAVKNMGTYFDAEVMPITQIKSAWNQGAMKGNSPAHKNFPDQMAIKTVISRACKLLVRGSDDSILYSQDEEDHSPIVVDEQVAYEIQEQANQEEIDIEIPTTKGF